MAELAFMVGMVDSLSRTPGLRGSELQKQDRTKAAKTA